MRTLAIVITMWMTLGVLAAGAGTGGKGTESQSLAIHFGLGRSRLSDADKARIRAMAGQFKLGPGDKIVVVGYADSGGDKDKNYQLSCRRAQSVRKEIIAGLGIEPTAVLAMGRGEESPQANNRTRQGRALNRRAEIYMARAFDGPEKRGQGVSKAERLAVEALTRDARDHLHQGRIDAALRSLEAARAKGGDQSSNWHAVCGIAGYYADSPVARIIAHLQTALDLDPFNQDAREFLGRALARREVTEGKVTPDMGRSAQNALPVVSMSQEYEYLSLFRVRPRSRHKLPGLPVDVWQGLDAQGAAVDYFFDHSRVYGWAFEKSGKTAAPLLQPSSDADRQDPAMTVARPGPEHHPTGESVPAPGAIWHSEVFQ